MAKRKRKGKTARKRNISFLPGTRGRKVISLFVFLAGIYILLACLSYISTWQEDQARVLQFSWEVLWEGKIELTNSMGRLGAIIAHQMIYWGFGVPTLGFLYPLILIGIAIWQGKWQKRYFRQIAFTFFVVAFLSICCAFAFSNASFPWGGSFGLAMTTWLENFLGSIGLLIALIFVVTGYFIWLFNPNPDQWNFQYLKDLFEWKLRTEDEDINPPTNPSPSEEREKAPQQPVPDASPASTGKTSEEEDADERDPFGKVEGLTKDQAEEAPEQEEERSPDQPGWESHKEEITEEEETEEEGKLKVEINKTPIESPHFSSQEEDRDGNNPYDPTLELSHYKYPQLEILEQHDDENISIDKSELEHNKKQIIKTLYNYKIEITKIRATIGPTVTLYEIIPAPGVRISKIKNLEDDIALSLAALGIRIIAPIPGRGTIGIEVPNKNKQIVSLKQVLQDPRYQDAKMELPIALGKDISNKVFIADLAKMPHLLIAGATGQGKSVGINSILMSLLYKKHPSQLKLVLVDPKKVELFPYSMIDNHFLAALPGMDEAIVTDTTQVVNTLASLCIEMDQRYELLKKAHARNLKEYNKKFIDRKLNPKKGHKFLPYIVLVIDEFADLIMTAGKEIELPIGRLAQLARAVGIHLIIATQRPSVNIITGIIKANFPARIAFKVTSKVDSRTILDASGADQLIGRGDMLFSSDSTLVRLQCAFVDTPEVEHVLEHIGQQQGYSEPYQLPEYDSEESSDPGAISVDEIDEMFNDAARLVVQNQHGSTSMIQRKLKLGYNRAGRIMDQLEHFGITGANAGSKPREVMIQSMDELEHILESLEDQKNTTPY